MGGKKQHALNQVRMVIFPLLQRATVLSSSTHVKDSPGDVDLHLTRDAR